MSENLGLIEALEPVARVLQAMGVRFFIGGSVASSYHGAARSTMAVDLVADLKTNDVSHFVSELQDEYYLSTTAIHDAISRLSCFNLIHLASSFEVDIFIFKSRPFDINSMNRAEFGSIELRNDFEFPIASPEDTILSKLEWYRLGNEASERQWDDVVRVMKVIADRADLEYMNRTASELNVADLLKKLLDSTK